MGGIQICRGIEDSGEQKVQELAVKDTRGGKRRICRVFGDGRARVGRKGACRAKDSRLPQSSHANLDNSLARLICCRGLRGAVTLAARATQQAVRTSPLFRC